jgi:hypothetical protein
VVTTELSSGWTIVRSSSVVNSTGDSPATLGVPTWVPEGTWTPSACGDESQNVRSVRADDDGYGSMPTRSRNLV